MTRVWPGLASLALAACGAPEPAIPVQDRVVPADERPSAPLVPKPGDPRWLALRDLAHCQVRIAADPSADGLALTWGSCPSGQPGCRALADEPETRRYGGGVIYGLEAGWTAAGVVLAIRDSDRITVAPLDGAPFLVLGIEGSSPCSFLGAAFDDTSVAIGLPGEDELGEKVWFYLAGPLHADPAWHSPAARLRGLDRVSLSGRTLVTATGPLRRSDPRTGEFIDLYDGRFTCCGFAVGAWTFFLADTGKISAKLGPDRPPIVLHHAPAGSVIGDLRRVGDAIYWAQGVGGQRDVPGRRFERVELWTALATDEPARFAPRKLAELDRRELPGERDDELVVGGGKLAVLDLDADAPRVHIVDTASGTQRVWQPDPELALRRVLFVDSDEIGVEVKLPGSDYTSVYMRLTLDTLPTPSRGPSRPRR